MMHFFLITFKTFTEAQYDFFSFPWGESGPRNTNTAAANGREKMSLSALWYCEYFSDRKTFLAITVPQKNLVDHNFQFISIISKHIYVLQ